jgi:membrane protein implicated in regulation of membrane protease activity
MTVSDLYLTCFVVGFLLSGASVLMGSLHPHLHLHLPSGGHVHVPHVPHVGHAPHAGHAPQGGARGATSSTDLPWVNFGTVTAFLAWFGGAGYLLTRYSHLVAVLSLLVAIAAGLIGAALVFVLVSKLLVASERPLLDSDFEMVGVLGRVSNSIREGGTGELIYSQAGSRRVCGARSDTGMAIPKGAEVVVTRYERGLAYVRTWDELDKDMSEQGTGTRD